MKKKLQNGFVYLEDICPSIIHDIKYASKDNFTGSVVKGYNKNIVITTEVMAIELHKVQQELETKNQTLLIWDTYRPTQAVEYFLQWKLKKDTPKIKERFYPDLQKEELFRGFISSLSAHSRGSAVDLTIFDKLSSKELDMGTNFDFFSERSYTNSKNITSQAQENRNYLIELMNKYNFSNYHKEWWHFSLDNEPFPEIYFNFPVE